MTEPQTPEISLIPPLTRDPAFWGMTAAQFLGAFNDNILKEVVLLLCSANKALTTGARDDQPLAMALFALPFVLFSGVAGFLSDRHSKRTVVVLCKLAEIVIVLLAVGSLMSGYFPATLAVLFLMGTHSAFFGPSKYGILPELVRERDLPPANGMFLMTTFIGIIFGTAAAGHLMAFIPGRLEWVALAFAGTATLGLTASLFVRKTPVARRELAFLFSDLAIDGETVHLILHDRQLFKALVMSSLFWLVGGIVQPAVNAFGERQLQVGHESTSWMVACLGIGIASGCMFAGIRSRNRSGSHLITWGAWGIVVCLGLLWLLGMSPLATGQVVWCSRIGLAALGGFAGLFSVPLQVFIQARPPAAQKGRVIGAMNLTNWVAILLAAGLQGAFNAVIDQFHLPISTVFAATALLILPAALLYTPPEMSLK